MNVVDRCTTCHQGITQASLRGTSRCRSLSARTRRSLTTFAIGAAWFAIAGKGAATEVAEAHEIHARLGTADAAHALHPGFLRQSAIAPIFPRRRSSLAAASSWLQFNCEGCHRLHGIERPDMLGPDLTNIGTKVSRQWIYKWLKEPRTIVDNRRQRHRERLRDRR